MAAILLISFRVIAQYHENWKTTFPKDFFHKNWLIIADHRYKFISEIKFEKKLFRYGLRGKTNFE